jgi:ATP-dependent Clp protease ATP-binding subunit ClpA
LTDAKGKKVNFKNTILIMTSNLGLGNNDGDQIGFGAANSKDDDMKDKVMEAFNDNFKPEFINRLDKIVLFNRLTKKDLSKIVNLELNKLSSRLSKSDINIKFDSTLKEYISGKAYLEDCGARPVRSIINDEIEPMITDIILSDGKDNRITLSIKNNKLNKITTRS